MSDRASNGALLGKAMKDLLMHWEKAGHAWKDQARADFEKEYVLELISAARAASNAAQQIEQFLAQVRNECS
ncbi:MAG: hypothetical protein HY716_09860 [Planctomycetes bacterium]|nr:hypothetical protein [Planctomycetota bacterium]